MMIIITVSQEAVAFSPSIGAYPSKSLSLLSIRLHKSQCDHVSESMGFFKKGGEGGKSGGRGGAGRGAGPGNGGGWPSTTGNPSGGGRSNNAPGK